MIKLKVGGIYKTSKGSFFQVISYDPTDGSTLDYDCSDCYYRNEEGRPFPDEEIRLHDAVEEIS